MKKLGFIAWFVCFYLVGGVFPAHAQKTKAQLNTEITTNFPDNTVGLITPAIARTTFIDFLNSWQQFSGVNAQTGVSYTVVVGDYGQLVTLNNVGAVAVTLPQATGSFSTFNTYVRNLGAGAVTITPTISTIDGNATLVLSQNQAAWIVSDGANYKTWFNSTSTVVACAGLPALTGDVTTSAGSCATSYNNVVGPAKGGTGVANNAASTITISGNFATTFTVTGATGVTLPTAGTLLANSRNINTTAPITGGGDLSADRTIACATCATTTNGGSLSATAPITISAAGVIAINAPYGSLTANNGGIVYSGAANLAILAGTATANQVLLSGSSTTPAWSTATYPATTTISQILYSSAANTIAGLATVNSAMLNTNSSGVPTLCTTVCSIVGSPNNAMPFALQNTNTGASAYAAFQALNSANNALFGIASTGYTGIAVLQNRAFIDAVAGTAGIVLNNEGANPIVLSVSNTEVGRWNGGLMVGTTTDPGTGVVNVLTGYRIGNAATTANVLRGNGTSFVSAALAAADLSNGVTGSGAVVLATTPTFITSLLTPIIAGGSAAGSTLIVESTTGAGTTDNITFKTASQTFAGFINTTQQWTIGSNNAPLSNVLLTVNHNASAPNASVGGTPIVQISNGNALHGIVLVDGFGTNSNPFITLRTGRGTLGAVTASQNTDNLGFFGAVGATAANTFADNTGVAGGGFFGVNAAENWSSTNQGTNILIYTTPKTTAVIALAATFNASGGLSIGSATDPGTGGLFVNGATITLNGLATDATHTDRTVCQDTTSKSLFFGSGAVGICLGTSSIRYKRDIEPMTRGLMDVAKLDPKSFYYLPGYGDDGAKRQYGLVAEDVIGVMPEIVGLDIQGRPNSVDWAALTPVMIHAIQELKADNDNLRQEIKQLRIK
jgi:Chaperone of endosialidase